MITTEEKFGILRVLYDLTEEAPTRVITRALKVRSSRASSLAKQLSNQGLLRRSYVGRTAHWRITNIGKAHYDTYCRNSKQVHNHNHNHNHKEAE